MRPAPAEQQAEPAAATGRLIDGRYLVGPRIARGGMASVYVGTDTRLDRTVAIKIMHPGLDEQDLADRFVKEARAAARLAHPNVVGIHDQGCDRGTVFLVMEHVAGQTLRDVITAEAPMPPTRALALLEPILAALGAAHRAGLIHRDVKPENVLVAADGSVKVADFGLARAISADTQHTVTGGILIGTVSYLAPELVVEGRADERSDVYAAGVLLYEMLTGVKPHTGETPIQVAYRHVHHDVPPPSRAVPGIPPYLDALVARATARDRARRPADATVFLHQVRRVAHALADGVSDDVDLTTDLALPAVPMPEDFAELLDPPTVDHRPESPSGPPVVDDEPRPRRRRRRGPLTLLVALALVAGLGVGAWWYGYGRYAPVPGVVGLTRSAATQRLEEAGLGVVIGDPEYSERVPAGRIIESRPAGGDRVVADGSVTLIVSLGKERYRVPELAGRNEDQAQDLLAEHHLTAAPSVARYHERVPEGTVLGTRPAAGTTMRPDGAVTLIVSRGPRPIRIADWTGKSAEEATSALKARGLVVTTVPRFHDTVASGLVISQNPVEGTLFRGDRVRLVVSKGPRLVAVPDGIRGSGVDAAREELTRLGFEVVVKHDLQYLGLGYVFRVEPGEGALVAKGGTITLYLI